MNNYDRLAAILRADPLRWHLLAVVQDLNLDDCWIGAGFIRNAVWDHLHQRRSSPIQTDIDVIWFDPLRADIATDVSVEAKLKLNEPCFRWSVKNQAYMHMRNGDAAYACASDAMRYWPETATAVAVKRDGDSNLAIAAPFGLDDLFDLVLRPTSGFQGERRGVFEARVRNKNWLDIWPRLKLA